MSRPTTNPVLPFVLPVVVLEQMPQQNEVRVPADDWTGLTDAAQRRKLQNRLNQRIYRKRRGLHLDRKNEMPETTHAIPDTSAIPDSDFPLYQKFRGLIIALQSQPHSRAELHRLSSDTNSSLLNKTGAATEQSPLRHQLGWAEINEMLIKYEDIAHRKYLLGSPRIDSLLTLIQFNVFRALICNTSTMGWTMSWLDGEDVTSPWFSSDSFSMRLSGVPSTLLPSKLQKTVEHHPWIDLWPIPKMRDNLLLADGYFDEDELCNDLVEFRDIPNEQTGLIVWGEPWDMLGWEVSEAFLRKWSWTIKGCVELVHSTNYWRGTRGEEPLLFDI